MTNEHDRYIDDGQGLPRELEQIASDLDLLGCVERADACADFEAMLLGVVQDPSSRMRLVHDSHDRAVPVGHQRRGLRALRLGLAAGVMLLVAGGVWMGLPGSGAVSVDTDEALLVALETEIDEWLLVASVFEDDVEQEIDLLFAETDSFNAGLSESWTIEDIFEEGSSL